MELFFFALLFYYYLCTKLLEKALEPKSACSKLTVKTIQRNVSVADTIWNSKKAIKRCPLHRGLSQFDLFCLENPH